MLEFLFGGHSAKQPPPGSYGPPTGEPDLDIARRLEAHYVQRPQCTGAWAEETTWSGTRCYHCGRRI